MPPILIAHNQDDPNLLMGNAQGLLATPGPQVDPVLAADIYLAMQTADSKEVDYDKQKVTDIVAIWDNLYTRWQPFFRSAYKMFRYLRTDQIDKEVREILRAEKRPELEYNFLLPLVVYLSGMITKNKSKMRANPISMGDETKSMLHTKMNEWAMNLCDGDYEIVRAAVNAVICGIGWTNNYWDTQRNKWITKSVSPFSVMFDIDATAKEDQSDWKWWTYHNYFTADDIISIYKLEGEDAATVRKNAEDLEGPYKGTRTPKGMMGSIWAGVLDFVDPYGRESSNLREGLDNWADLKSGLYRVVELHDMRAINKVELYNPLTREKVEVPDVVLKDEELRRRFTKEQYAGWMERTTSHTELWITAVCQKLLPNKPLMESPNPIQERGGQFKPLFWYDFDPDPTESKGMLHNLIGNIDFNNQRMMTFLTWMMKGVTPNIWQKKDSIDAADLPDWQSKEYGKILTWSKEAPVLEKLDAQVGTALSGSAEHSVDQLDKLSGVSPNSMGRAETNKEGVGLFSARVQSGMVMLEHGFGHIQRHQEQVFSYCDRNLQTFLTMPRAIRLFGEPPKGMEGVKMDKTTQDAYWLELNKETLHGVLNDVTEGEYDFHADPTQLGQTMKQANFLMKSDLMEKMPPELQLIMAPYVVRGSDDPDAIEIAAKMQKFVDAKMGIMDQQMQMELLKGQQGLAQGQKALSAPSPAEMAMQGAQEGAVA